MKETKRSKLRGGSVIRETIKFLTGCALEHDLRFQEVEGCVCH